MSHIHLPDGILPVWLWGAGWLIVIMYFILAGRFFRSDLNKKISFAAIFAAVMVIAQSVEIVPIAYHLNLSVVSGIFLGPVWIAAAAFVVNLILSMFGHGGITVVGINTIIMSCEGILGYYIFKISAVFLKNLYARGFLTTFVSLVISTILAIFIVYAGTRSLVAGLEVSEKLSGSFSMFKFVSLTLLFGAVGWTLESFISAATISYLNKVRPNLIQ